MRSRSPCSRRPYWCWPSRTTSARLPPQPQLLKRRRVPHPGQPPTPQPPRDPALSGSWGSSDNNKAGTQGHRLRAMDSVGASEGGTPGAKDPGVERWVSWGTSGGADGVPSKLTARSQAVEDCWSRGLRSARSSGLVRWSVGHIRLRDRWAQHRTAPGSGQSELMPIAPQRRSWSPTWD